MFDLKGYETSLLEGAWVTLEVALASLLLALLLGMLGALAKLSPTSGRAASRPPTPPSFAASRIWC